MKDRKEKVELLKKYQFDPSPDQSLFAARLWCIVTIEDKTVNKLNLSDLEMLIKEKKRIASEQVLKMLEADND